MGAKWLTMVVVGWLWVPLSSPLGGKVLAAESHSPREESEMNVLSPQGESEDTVRSPKKESWLKRTFEWAYEIVKDFDRPDTNYITPQKYNYTVMLQGTHTYERYTLRSGNGQTVVLEPKPSLKLGPYVGWRWIFWGYQLDFSHLKGDGKTEFDLSLYSSMLGIDIFSRRNASDYRISEASQSGTKLVREIDGASYDGIEVNVKGFNLYYIQNHRKFSYPAAFSQTNVQKRSAGSWLMGIGYTHHNVKLDYQRLRSVITEKTNGEMVLDSTFNLKRINYTDASVSVGYAYNWVLAPRLLFAASLSLALGYKRTVADAEDGRFRFSFKEFRFSNLNIDGVGRFGLVYNTMRWYAGASAILHTYNYNKSRISLNSTFGNFNIYLGYNFGKRHRDHKKKK